MPIGAHLAINVEIIQQHKLIDERMVVRCYIFAKDTKAAIAVPFGNVPEQLIVGSVFFNNVNTMLDRTGFSYLRGNRIVGGSLSLYHRRIFPQRSALKGQPCHFREFVWGWRRDRRHGPLEKSSDVLGDILGSGLQWIGAISVVLAR